MAVNPIKTIRMSDELYDDMRMYCSISGMTMADFIRDAVDEYIKKAIADGGFQARAEAMFAKDQAILSRLQQRGSSQ